MRRKLLGIIALMIALCCLTAVCAEGDPNALLEENLNITDSIREAFDNQRLIDTRKEIVEDAGITVMLDECVGDSHHIRAAFRVSGKLFSEEDQPLFKKIRIEVPGLDNDGEPASAGFINWVEDGHILWNDRSGAATYFFAAYTAEEDFTFDEKQITVTLETLCVEGNPKPVADGKWVFSWDLRCSDRSRKLTGLNLEIPETKAVLKDVDIGPMHLFANLVVPGYFDGESPYISGFILKDGTRIEHAMESVSTMPQDRKEGTVYHANHFNRVIDPGQVASLLISSHAWNYGDTVIVDLP